MNKFTAQAPTVEEAVQIALDALNVKKEDAEIKIEEEGRKGFLGLGQKDAVVTVAVSKADQAHHETHLKDLDFVGQMKNDEENQAIKEDKQAEHTAVQKDPAAVDENSELSDSTVQDEAGEDPREENKLSDDQAIEAVSDYIQTIGYALGLDEVELEVYREWDTVYFDIHSDKPGIIIGRHGKVLDAIHTLSQIYLRNYAQSKLNLRLDTENYRGRKEESIKSLAERSAEKVMKTKQAEILEAMPAKERKLVHHILSDNPHVSTHSEGEEPHRFLVIEPADI